MATSYKVPFYHWDLHSATRMKIAQPPFYFHSSMDACQEASFKWKFRHFETHPGIFWGSQLGYIPWAPFTFHGLCWIQSSVSLSKSLGDLIIEIINLLPLAWTNMRLTSKINLANILQLPVSPSVNTINYWPPNLPKMFFNQFYHRKGSTDGMQFPEVSVLQDFTQHLLKKKIYQ